MSGSKELIFNQIGRRVTPFTLFRLRAHGWCDRSAEDAYSSMASDPAFAFVGGPCCPTHELVYMFWDYDYVNTLFTSPIYIDHFSVSKERPNIWYKTCQTAFDPMAGHIGKLNCYNDHRIYEMLPLNVTVETPATTTCL